MDSAAQHFRYDVFKKNVLDNEYEGISRIVRERLNDPDYFNNRLRGIADAVRDNVARSEQEKKAKERAKFRSLENEAAGMEEINERDDDFEVDSG